MHRAGYRSGLYASALVCEHGFQQEHVLNLEGSILAATQAGMPLVVRSGAKPDGHGSSGGAASADGAYVVTIWVNHPPRLHTWSY